MKKSMIFAGLLAIGYANAQEYDGKVGINTNEPKATLDITPEANNLTGTTNEGIIAPRLSKTRIANIEASKLTEGTLVYSTDAVYTAGADTAKNNRVAKINEKGYYFYNGTEWVKVQYKDTDTNDAEWVYDDTTKRINLKRSGSGDFKNKVFYNVQTGGYLNYDNPNIVGAIDPWGIVGNTNVSDISSSSTTIPYVNVNQMNADRIKINKINGQAYSFGAKSLDILTIDNNTANGSDYQKNISNSVFNTLVPAGTTSRLGQLGTLYAKTSIQGGAVEGGGGISSIIDINNAQLRGFSVGVNAQAAVNGVMSSTEASAMPLRLRNTIGYNSNTTLENIYGALINQQFGRYDINIRNVSGVYTDLLLNANSSTKIQNMHGIYINGNRVNTTTYPKAEITNNYGLRIADVVGGKTSNYAIYSNAGKVRVGDLADTSATADRTVVVDKDGVLKVGSATASTGATTLTGEENLECNATNRGKMNFVKNDAGFDVFGICMKGTNGYSWRYIYGNGGVSTGSGNFGSGLQ